MDNILIFAAIQVALLVGTRAEYYCPYRWEPWGGRCLDLSDLIGTGNEAELHCEDIGGSLVIVEDQYQDDYLKERLFLGNVTTVPLGCSIDEDDVYWTCAAKEEDQWFWYNATSYAGYWNWESGQPDNSQDTSGRIFLNEESDWTDEYRDNRERYMMVACLTPTIDDEVKCPLSWQAVDNKCVYFANDYSGRPREVRTICGDLGGSMLTIDSQGQNDFITAKLGATGSNAVVLGCNDQGDEGFWRCDDRVYPYMVHWREDTKTGFWNWGQNEPADTDPEADCAILRQNGLWKALTCQDQYTMLLTCEQSPTNVVCPAGFEPYYGDVCLQLVDFTGSATAAKQQCLSKGGSLIVIENEGQNVFLQYELEAPVNQLAIACSDEAEEGTWICDGKDPTEWYWKSAADFQGYWNWKPDEPISGRDNNCMYLFRKAGNNRAVSCDESFEMKLGCVINPDAEVPSTKQPNTDQTTRAIPTTELDISTHESTSKQIRSTTDLRKSTTDMLTTKGRSTTDIPTTKGTTVKDAPTSATTKTALPTSATTVPSRPTVQRTTTPDSGNTEPQEGLSPGSIVGIVIGVMILIVLVISIGFFFLRKQKSATLVKNQDQDLSEF